MALIAACPRFSISQCSSQFAMCCCVALRGRIANVLRQDELYPHPDWLVHFLRIMMSRGSGARRAARQTNFSAPSG